MGINEYHKPSVSCDSVTILEYFAQMCDLMCCCFAIQLSSVFGFP